MYFTEYMILEKFNRHIFIFSNNENSADQSCGQKFYLSWFMTVIVVFFETEQANFSPQKSLPPMQSNRRMGAHWTRLQNSEGQNQYHRLAIQAQHSDPSCLQETRIVSRTVVVQHSTLTSLFRKKAKISPILRALAIGEVFPQFRVSF